MAFNGTVPNALTELYPGLTDFSSLNWFEQQWVAWYVWIGNPIIATGLMSFLLHEVCRLVYFFLGCANRTFGVTAQERTAPHCLAFLLLHETSDTIFSVPRSFISDVASHGSS
jgi:hypothetical protein